MTADAVMAVVATRSHLDQVLALVRSVRRTWTAPPPVHLALVDYPGEAFDVPAFAGLDVTLHDASGLGVTDWDWLCVKYDAAGLCCAVKPFLVARLLERGAGSVLYCDADLLFLADGRAMLDRAPDAPFVVVPHMRAPLPAYARLLPPAMDDIAGAGMLNAGLFVARDRPQTRAFLDGWGVSCVGPVRTVPAVGYQQEQLAFNWVTSFVDGVVVDRDAGTNVAYWNLHERPLAHVPDATPSWTAGGQPLVSFHFSGHRPGGPRLSEHDLRGLHDLDPAVRALCAFYADELAAATRDLGPAVPYPRDVLDGIEVEPDLRLALRRAEPDLRRAASAGWEATARDAVTQLHRVLAPAPLIPAHVAEAVLRRRDLAPLYEPDALYPGELLSWLTVGFPLESPLGAFYAASTPFVAARAAGGARIPAHEPATCLRYLHAHRPDLCEHFPDPVGADREGFAHWLAHDLQQQYEVPDAVAALAADFDVGRALARVLARVQRHPALRELIRAEGLTVPAIRWLAPEAARAEGYDATDLAIAEWWAATRPDAEALRAPVAPIYPAVPAPPPSAPADRTLLNVLGHFASPIGLGSASRGVAAAAEAAGLRTRRVVLTNMTMVPDLHLADLATQPDPTAGSSLVVTFPHLDFDVLDVFPGAFAPDGRTIAYLAWEQRRCPPVWASRFAPFDRLFALSQFAADAIAEGFDRPCHALPCVVEVGPRPERDRAAFGLPEDAFVVGMVLDATSSLERKNPVAAVRAVGRAFAGRSDVVVVLKVGGAASRADRLRVQEVLAVLEDAGVAHRLVTEVLARPQVEALFACMDVYLSMHRAEGFGYTMAEAMGLGVPVVATGYSGNMDFMSEGNSFPVPVREVRVERPEGPFATGTVWADPDVDAAAERLRFVLEQPAQAAAVAARGREDVVRLLSAEAVGRRLSALLA